MPKVLVQSDETHGYWKVAAGILRLTMSEYLDRLLGTDPSERAEASMALSQAHDLARRWQNYRLRQTEREFRLPEEGLDAST